MSWIASEQQLLRLQALTVFHQLLLLVPAILFPQT